MKPRWKKGTVLLQTMIMSLVLSMISVMLLKWVLARYMVAARSYRSTTTTARTVGYSQRIFSQWNFNTGPGVLPATPDSKTITYGTAGSGMVTVTMTSDEDQP